MTTLRRLDPASMYVVCYKPGLNGWRYHIQWVDGVASNVPGGICKQFLKGAPGMTYYPYPTTIDWVDGRAVPRGTPGKKPRGRPRKKPVKRVKASSPPVAEKPDPPTRGTKQAPSEAAK